MKNYINNVGVEILFNNKPAKIYTHEGNLFLEAREDSEYSIKIVNNNNYRILATIGVDGINVIDGKNNSKDSPGYIIDKYDSLKLKGYRISDDEVAQFKFCKNGESYASSKSIDAQNGIICVSCYAEYERPQTIVIEEPIVIKKKKIIIEEEPEYVPSWPTYTWWGTPCPKPYFGDLPYTICRSTDSGLTGKGSNNVSCNFLSQSQIENSFSLLTNNSPSSHFDMGSNWGKAIENKVIKVEFVKGKYLGLINIYYASKKSLKDMGVNIENVNKIVFPKGMSEYCTPPSGWKK